MVIAALLLLAAPAAGHAYLDASTPAEGATVATDASVMALRFTERIDGDHAQARLWNGTGEVPVRLDAPRERPHDLRIVAIPLHPGEHRLAWRVLALDGHVVTGTLTFHVGDAGPAGSGDRVQEATAWDPWETLGRALFFAGIALVVGLPVFMSEVARFHGPPRRIVRTIAAASGVALVGAAVLAVQVAGAADVPWWRIHHPLAGRLALARLGMAVAACAAAAIALRAPRAYAVAALPGFLSMSVHAMGGHGLSALASAEGVAGHVAFTVHLAAAALWMAGIVGFLLVVPLVTTAVAAGMLGRFFAIAVVSAGAVGLTGIYEAYVHGAGLPTGGDAGPYEATLAAKTGLWAGLLLLGAFHAYLWRPRPASGPVERPVHPQTADGADVSVQGTVPAPAAPRGTRPPWTLRAEAALAACVLVAAAVLASVAAPIPPAGSAGPPAVFEATGATQDYGLRLMVEGDPLRAQTPYDVVLHVHALTSRGPEDIAPVIELRHPTRGTHPLVLEAGARGIADAAWLGRVTFPGPGAWSLVAELGGHQVLFDVPVAAPKA